MSDCLFNTNNKISFSFISNLCDYFRNISGKQFNITEIACPPHINWPIGSHLKWAQPHLKMAGSIGSKAGARNILRCSWSQVGAQHYIQQKTTGVNLVSPRTIYKWSAISPPERTFWVGFCSKSTLSFWINCCPFIYLQF